MDVKLQICLILGTLLFGAIIICFLAKKKLHLKYTLIWLGADLVMLLAAIFYNITGKAADLVGIKSPVNFVFVVFGVFAILIIFMLTAIVSHMNARIFSLVQSVALLEERVRTLEQQTQEKDGKEIEE